MSEQHVHDAVVIGAGFGGMGATIALRRRGLHDVVVLEREDDLGGTWHVNRYPGLAVDIPSATYSYSFAPNPRWSRLYAPGAELKQYATDVADRFDLRRHMRFSTTARRADWDESAGRWVVEVESGDGAVERLHATYLLTATGFLSQPKKPDIAGIGDFAGTVLHTTRWDDGHDLAGERVAVIGTGATAVQLIPEIAARVRHLTVFQRTPIWVTAKLDAAVPRPLQALYARVPATQRVARGVGSAVLEAIMVLGVLQFRRLKALNHGAERMARRHLRRQVPDLELRERLTPDYSFGCKRPTFSNTYYPTFSLPHVTLETTSIDHVEADAIVTTDGTRHEIDTLVLATGFDLWDANFPALPVVGRGGADLGRFWREQRFQAYQGISVPGFPNFFSLNSPYSYSGLSYFTTIESQMRHLDRLLRAVQEHGASTVEVTPEANARFLARVRRLVDDSVFAQGSCGTARSYYFNQHGEATLLRPTSTRNAFREAATFPLEDYRIA